MVEKHIDWPELTVARDTAVLTSVAHEMSAPMAMAQPPASLIWAVRSLAAGRLTLLPAKTTLITSKINSHAPELNSACVADLFDGGPFCHNNRCWLKKGDKTNGVRCGVWLALQQIVLLDLVILNRSATCPLIFLQIQNWQSCCIWLFWCPPASKRIAIWPKFTSSLGQCLCQN